MTSFHPFTRLPFELRAQIWELTVEPRTVEVRFVRETFVSSTPVPAPLQTCREARSLGLYQQTFSELSGSEARYVWLNLDIDMVSIATCSFAGFKPVAHLIKRLRFERAITNESFYYWEADEIRTFVNAKEMHVVCEDGMRAWHEATKEHYFPCGRENVFFIDPYEDRIMRSTELDDMCDKELAEAWAAEGYDYFTGLPLDQDT